MITLVQANTIIETAFAYAGEHELKPLSVVVLDAGGAPIAFQRQDGASFLRFKIAFGKAYGGLAVGVSSRTLGVMGAERPLFMQSLNGLAGGDVIPVPGGVLVQNADGQTIGAVGITGDTSDMDEAAGVAGIEAASLSPIV